MKVDSLSFNLLGWTSWKRGFTNGSAVSSLELSSNSQTQCWNEPSAVCHGLGERRPSQGPSKIGHKGFLPSSSSRCTNKFTLSNYRRLKNNNLSLHLMALIFPMSLNVYLSRAAECKGRYTAYCSQKHLTYMSFMHLSNHFCFYWGEPWGMLVSE